MHPANQRPRKPDKLFQGAYSQASYPRIQWENTLDKRGTTEPQGKEGKTTTTEGNVRSRAGARAYELPMLQEARNQA